MSREERQRGTSSSKKDFWWLCEDSITDSSTPKEESPGAKRTKRFTPHSPINPYKGLSEKRDNGVVCIFSMTAKERSHNIYFLWCIFYCCYVAI